MRERRVRAREQTEIEKKEKGKKNRAYARERVRAREQTGIETEVTEEGEAVGRA